MTNCTGFVREFNLMPQLIGRLGLDDTTQELFLLKLSMIYQAMVRKAEREAKENMGK